MASIKEVFDIPQYLGVSLRDSYKRVKLMKLLRIGCPNCVQSAIRCWFSYQPISMHKIFHSRPTIVGEKNRYCEEVGSSSCNNGARITMANGNSACW